MKILLLGEFSGVHNKLKRGLEALGHEVVLSNSGDSYKKFSQDINITPFKGRYFGKLLNIIWFFLNIRKYIGYDVVQFINPFATPYYFSFLWIPNIIFGLNKQLIYYACGTDPAYINSYKKFKYFPYDTANQKFLNFARKVKQRPYRHFLKKIHKIIPSSYSYAIGYWDNIKLQSPIPLPGSGKYISTIKPVGNKKKILFGITRRDFKGADYILEALGKVKKQYLERVEINIVERLPFDEYEKKLKNCDILIDQCRSYGYGMNAIFALEKGVVVLSGAEQAFLDYNGLKDCPVINIVPNTNQIQKELTALINLSQEDFNILKEKSLEYVCANHDPEKIARLMLDCYMR